MFWKKKLANHDVYFLLSLRGKICISISVMLGLLLAVYGIMAYTELRKDLITTAQNGLQAQVLPSVYHLNTEYTPSNESLHATAETLIKNLQDQGLKARFYDARGKEIRSTDNTIPVISAYDLLNTSSSRFLVFYNDANSQLVYICPLKSSSSAQIYAWLEASSSFEHVEKSLKQEGIILLGGGLAVLSIAFILSYLLVGLILRPLTDLMKTAQVVARSDLTPRAREYSGHNELSGLVSSFNTMLDRLENSFAAQQRAYEEVRQFAADASHELRSPLTTVTGYVDILQRGAASTPEEQDRIFSAIHRELARLTRLVDNLLTLARLEARLPFQKQPTDLGALLSEASQRAHLLDAERNITTDIDVECMIQADTERLRQMINNLIDNALYHSGSGASIDIGCLKEADQIILWVKDSGKGMSEEEVTMVFKRFWRSSASRNISRGTGLGLSIVQAIADSHGGRVEVTSVPGCGTTFKVYLPCK